MPADENRQPYASGERLHQAKAVSEQFRQSGKAKRRSRQRGELEEEHAGLRLAHTAGAEQSLLSLKLENGSILHRNSASRLLTGNRLSFFRPDHLVLKLSQNH